MPTAPTFSPASGGCVGLISSGTSAEESAFLDASENGDDVFFLTASRLVPQDVDTALDVYDAHVCSAASPCPPPSAAVTPACEGDACQQPADPAQRPHPGHPHLQRRRQPRRMPQGQEAEGQVRQEAKNEEAHKNTIRRQARSERESQRAGGAK